MVLEGSERDDLEVCCWYAEGDGSERWWVCIEGDDSEAEARPRFEHVSPLSRGSEFFRLFCNMQ